jgi:tRNA pseudouridine65 synthase
MLSILYSDSYITIINKPCGMLVHRTSIAGDDEPVALQLLREQTGRMVYAVNRIDRPTSGIVVFAHTPEIAKLLQEEMAKTTSCKHYTALVRGWIHDSVTWYI